MTRLDSATSPASLRRSTPRDAPARPRATLALTSAATAVALMTYTAPMVTLPDTAAALHTPLSAQAWLLNGAPLGLAALLLVAGSLAASSPAPWPSASPPPSAPSPHRPGSSPWPASPRARPARPCWPAPSA